MPSSLEKIDFYKIDVQPWVGVHWDGLFNFKPDANDVAAAIRADITKLDEEVEHEYDMIQNLRQTLELVTHLPEILGEVRIAGTYVGEIYMTIIKVFRKEQSRLPQYSIHNNPCGEIPLSDPVPMSKVQSDLWRDNNPNLTDTSEVPTKRVIEVEGESRI